MFLFRFDGGTMLCVFDLKVKNLHLHTKHTARVFYKEIDLTK